jgi:hypothetical protein
VPKAQLSAQQEAQLEAPAPDSASLFLLHVALEVAARAVATVGAVGHGAHAVARPVVHVVLRPPLVPKALQPATLLGGLARGGSDRRPELLRELTDAVNEAIAIVDLNAIITRLDLEAAMKRVDLARLTTELIAEIDLPEIIRESTGAVASETVRGVRMQSHSGDDAIARAVARLRLRGHRHAVTRTPSEPVAAGPLPATPAPAHAGTATRTT